MSLQRPLAEDPYAKLPALPSFAVTSTDVQPGEPLKTDQVLSGGNTSPQLSWSGAPEGTRSYVVSCFDPDAPTPSGYWHWTAVDIAADVTSLPPGAGDSDDTLPGEAFHVRNDGGSRGYEGAAPPEGDHAHRYFYVVHAVGEATLGVDQDTSPTAVAFNLAFKAVGRGMVIGTHQS